MSQLHNVAKKSLGILLFINIPLFPSGFWSPEQQGEPGVALFIFRVFILNGVVSTLIPKHGRFHRIMLGWQSTGLPPTFVEQCSDCCTSSWRCLKRHGYFWFLLLSSLRWCFLLSLKEDLLLLCCYGSHLLALQTSKQLFKCFTFSTLFGNHYVCLSFFYHFKDYDMVFYKWNHFNKYSHGYIYFMCKTVSCTVLFSSGWQVHSKSFGWSFLICLQKIYLGMRVYDWITPAP